MAAVGDLVIYRAATEIAVARVDIVRERDLTVFPWRHGDRQWERRRSRVRDSAVLRVLPGDTDPAPIADQLNAIRNRRTVERQEADRLFAGRIERLLKSCGGAN